MNQLKKAVDFVKAHVSKEVAKNLSLFILTPLATLATTGLIITTGMNDKLQDNLKASEAEAVRLESELTTAQETIDDLNSQFATATTQVTKGDALTLNGRGEGTSGVLKDDRKTEDTSKTGTTVNGTSTTTTTSTTTNGA